MAQLTQGLQIDDDVGLRVITETLTIQCQLTHRNIALLTRVALDDLESFLNDPASIPLEKKYELAIRTSYLINAVVKRRIESRTVLNLLSTVARRSWATFRSKTDVVSA